MMSGLPSIAQCFGVQAPSPSTTASQAIGPDVLEEIARVLAVEDFGRVADAGLALLELVVILALIGLAGRDVADLLEAEGDRVIGPDVDGVAQDGVQRLGHVEVAHAAAGDAGSAGARPRLVEHDDVLARAAAARLELHREMPGGGEAVDAGADHGITRRIGKGL